MFDLNAHISLISSTVRDSNTKWGELKYKKNINKLSVYIAWPRINFCLYIFFIIASLWELIEWQKTRWFWVCFPLGGIFFFLFSRSGKRGVELHLSARSVSKIVRKLGERRVLSLISFCLPCYCYIRNKKNE